MSGCARGEGGGKSTPREDVKACTKPGRDDKSWHIQK